MERGIVVAAVAAAFFVAGADAKPFKTELKSKWLDFEYGWSSEANAIPALVARFSADMRKQRASLTAQAQKDAADRKKQGFPFNAYEQVTSITTVGETPRLLSLSNDTYEFAGGAHGNSGTKAILWDRRLNRQIDLNALFRTGSSYLTTIRGPYCSALKAERKKRRQGEQLGDPKKKGRFNQILIVADPYVAGPYVEGSYDISVPVTAALITKLKPEYRPSFGN
jgi:hypothetical protein